MKDYMKTYEIILKAKAPVFIGDGKRIEKKEYVFLSNNSVGIIDIEKLYGFLKRKGKAIGFEKYMLSNNRDNLNVWLRSQSISVSDIKNTFKYELKSCDYIDRRERGLQVMSFIKDPYGKPYVPGSSLKGMLRTILISMDIMENRKKYKSVSDSINDILDPGNTRKIYRTQLLKKEVSDLEAISLRTLEREHTNNKDAVNDVMQGFIVSDSYPLSVKDLALCQKIEVHKDGEEKSLPLLRESLKPETEIKFKLTIDSSVCKFDHVAIKKAIKMFIEQYYDNFLVKFKEDRPTDNTVYLGGGPGFLSKTVIYPLFKEKGVEAAFNIFNKTGVANKHRDDLKLNLSPHILKCTHYDGKLFQFGQCELFINQI